MDGMKTFTGTVTVVPRNGMKPFDITGTWTYKPQYDTWYVHGDSFPAEILTNFRKADGQTAD